MNLKEFDAKQFLLEKGERVGLGIAVTLMVLMLIVSLFMPSRGFFSGSPAAKAEVLKAGTASLEAKLKDRNVKPGPADSPPTKSERHLIALDTNLLESQIYETGPWYEPAVSISSGRQTPLIKNITEAVIKVVHIPIDTYIFNPNFTKVTILRNPDKKAAADGKGANNNVNRMAKMLQANSGPAGRGGRPFTASGQNVQGADEKGAYETPLIPLDKVDGQELARQPRPLRMAIIAASFPYKDQLEEFKNKLRLATVEDVLKEPVEDPNDNSAQLAAFRFLGVEVQRKEFDLKGKEISDWKDLDLHANYKVWLMHSGLPFEEDDPKYDPIKFYSLVWPRLREFHAEKPQEQMGMAGPRGRAARPQAVAAVPRHEGESKYPDVESELPSIQATLKSLADVEPQKIAGPPGKFQVGNVDFFNPNPTPLENQAVPGRQPRDGAGAQQEAIIPEHCLVRLIDVNIEPGHYYRYRVKIRMANPNYNNPNVASPDYKKGTELKSKKWLEVPLTVSVPPETIYYVVDQKHVKDVKKEDKPTKDKDTARFYMWNREPDRDRQVVFQFHRWIESTLVGSDVVPIGEWSVADRVFVARGEYIGQKVKVDLPVWKYTLDSFVLPIEDQKARKVRTQNGVKIPTGVTVNFGQDNPENETILVDFEGGREALRDSASKVDDVSGIQVLMLSPDGRLRARNGAADAKDEDREKRRAAVLKRIEEVREGKTAGGAAPRGGGLDGPRGR